MGFIYKDAIFGDKIIFPSNYLTHFYAPWSTEKFVGWEQGIPDKPLGTDLIRFFYPQWQAGLKLWNPYIFAGNPVMANFQSAVFYPLTYLPWAFLIILPPLLGAIFTFLYLKSLKLKFSTQVLGAMAFGFSGFIVTWSQEAIAVAHTAIWLPLVFYGIETKKGIVLILALAMCILAGYLQIAVYIFGLAFFYSFYKKTLRLFVVCCLLAVGVASVQLIPSFTAFLQSPRPTVKIDKVFDTYLLSPFHLVKTVAPDINGHPGSYNYFGNGSYNETSLYIGVIPLIFALLAIFSGRAKFFAVSAIITFILTSNLPFIKTFLTLPFWPLIPTFQPSRILILTTFCLAVLSAVGMDYYTGSGRPRHGGVAKITAMGLIILVILSLVYYKFYLTLPRDFLVVVKNCILPLGFLGAFLGLTFFIKYKRIFLVGVFVLTIFGQYYFFNRYLNLGEKEFLYPSHPIFKYLQDNQENQERFISFGQQILGNFPTVFKVYSPEGFDPIFSKRYGQLVTYAKTGQFTENIPRIEVMVSELRASDGGILAEGLTDNPRRLRLLLLLGVKNILYHEEPSLVPMKKMFPAEIFTATAVLGKWQAYQYKNALPRAFLVNNYIVEKDPQKILDKIFDPNFDLRKAVVLEEDFVGLHPDGDRSATLSKSNAVITSYKATCVTIETESDSPKILFLSDNYYVGWKAFVNGVETKIYRANFSFRAVAVPAGKNLVVFTFEL